MYGIEKQCRNMCSKRTLMDWPACVKREWSIEAVQPWLDTDPDTDPRTLSKDTTTEEFALKPMLGCVQEFQASFA